MREATEKAEIDYTNIQADHNTLKQEVTQRSSYLNAKEHVITHGMESRTAWRQQAKNNLKKFAHLTALVNTHDIACAEIDMETLGIDLNELKNMISIKIENIEEADDKRDLYYDRHPPTHANHRETLPNFAKPGVRTHQMH